MLFGIALAESDHNELNTIDKLGKKQPFLHLLITKNAHAEII